MEKTLKQRALNSSNWVIVSYVFSQGFRLGGNLILTRLLVPEMFGVMAIVSVLLVGIAMFSDLGIFQYIIQSKHSNKQSYVNTAWTIQILRGGLITLVLLGIAEAFYLLQSFKIFADTSVYSVPELPLIIAVMSITALIAGFNSINLALLNKDLRLKEIGLIDVFSQLIGLICMIFLAYLLENIWALVIGTILSSFVKMLMSHLPSFGERNKISWDTRAVKDIFNFGKWIFGASIFTFFAGQGDRLILGGLLTPEELGIYTIAFFLATAFRNIVHKVMSSVFYPVLSEVVRTRPTELQTIYYKIRSRVDIVVMIVVGFLASSGHLFIELLYDDRYIDAGWMLESLSLATIFVGITMAGTCVLALGNSRVIMKLTATSSVALFVTVPIAHIFFGIEGAVFAIALNSIVELPLLFLIMKKYKLLDWKKEIRFFPLFFLCYATGYLSLQQLGL
jgi:O-antigen/teichoic acid export membrane protein